ncbi:MAG: 3D domain-containing protein [Planctomycetes bacterium]|nr:3D domain-containing protein [Planctomycetota bacterium]
MLGLRSAGVAVAVLLFASGALPRPSSEPPGGEGVALGREMAVPEPVPAPTPPPALAPPPPSSQIPPGYVYWKTIQARVTAYEPSSRSCGKSADGMTSLGDNAWRMDGCAVDPRAIPYRTLIEVPGLGVREADDTGGAMRRSWDRHRRFHIDVRFPYVAQAREWGVQTLYVNLYRKPETRKAPKETTCPKSPVPR